MKCPSGFGTLHPQKCLEQKELLAPVCLLSNPAGRKVQTGGKPEFLSSATSLPEPTISPAKLTKAHSLQEPEKSPRKYFTQSPFLLCRSTPCIDGVCIWLPWVRGCLNGAALGLHLISALTDLMP